MGQFENLTLSIKERAFHIYWYGCGINGSSEAGSRLS